MTKKILVGLIFLGLIGFAVFLTFCGPSSSGQGKKSGAVVVSRSSKGKQRPIIPPVPGASWVYFNYNYRDYLRSDVTLSMLIGEQQLPVLFNRSQSNLKELSNVIHADCAKSSKKHDRGLIVSIRVSLPLKRKGFGICVNDSKPFYSHLMEDLTSSSQTVYISGVKVFFVDKKDSLEVSFRSHSKEEIDQLNALLPSKVRYKNAVKVPFAINPVGHSLTEIGTSKKVQVGNAIFQVGSFSTAPNGAMCYLFSHGLGIVGHVSSLCGYKEEHKQMPHLWPKIWTGNHNLWQYLIYCYIPGESSFEFANGQHLFRGGDGELHFRDPR